MDIAGSVYFPNDCHLTPGRFLTGLTERLQQAGVRFVWNAEAERIVGNSLHTTAGVFEADHLVLAGGAYTPTVARSLSVRLPMQAGKGYSVTLPNPCQLPDICAILTEARVAVTPMGTSLRVGGTMEITGNDTTVNPRRVQGILKSVPRYYPKFAVDDFTDLPVWAGLRPCTPDGLPYIGRLTRHPQVLVATGHAMMGLSLGPVTGQLVASLLANEPPAVDLRLLSPERFG
jgi:D-amino-acid dehydrogenase